MSVRETWTDNVSLVPSAFSKGDFVTELSPTLLIQGRGRRVSVDLDYRPTALLYARDSNRNDLLNLLNASGSIEAVDRLFYVDARAQISQQAISAFGPQISSNVSVTSNRTETRVFSLSPYLKGVAGDLARYEVRYQATSTRTQEQSAAQGDSKVLTADAASISDFAQIGWLADYRDAKYDYRRGDDVRAQRARGTLIYHFDPELWFTLRGGRESNDFSGSRRSFGTYGVGFQWAPTPRTRISAEQDHRFFGSGYRYSFRHRVQGISYSLLATKDDTTTTEQLTRNSVGTLFERFSDLLAGQFPDPQQRSEQVRQLLMRTGIPQESVPLAGFLSSSVQLEKRIEGSVALIGARNTWTVSAYQRTSRALSLPDTVPPNDPNFSAETKELGVFLNLNHQITRETSISGSAAWQRNRGDGGDRLEAVSKRVELAILQQFSPSTSGSIGLRTVWFDGGGLGANDYTEHAIFGGLNHRF